MYRRVQFKPFVVLAYADVSAKGLNHLLNNVFVFSQIILTNSLGIGRLAESRLNRVPIWYPLEAVATETSVLDWILVRQDRGL